MAFTPIDPTKAEVRTTDLPDGSQTFDFYFPQGPKGDPGGLVAGTNLFASNLNEIVISGVYRQDNGPMATLLRNYPKESIGGVMLVFERVLPGAFASVFQHYYPSVNSIAGPATMYVRYSTNNHASWSPWRAFASTRVDQTAGRAVYQWDDLNQREQLIYGDTGWRAIALDPTYGVAAAGNHYTLPNGAAITASTLKLRRVGSKVILGGEGALQPKADYSSTAKNVCGIPVGFRESGSQAYNICRYGNNGGDTGQRLVMIGIPADYANPAWVSATPLIDTNWNNYATGTAWPKLYGGIWVYAEWHTNEPWPTSLPGTAVGTIPNT